jgi:hypothetical protein
MLKFLKKIFNQNELFLIKKNLLILRAKHPENAELKKHIDKSLIIIEEKLKEL